jgi:cellulose synthase/poly-beta-1,6-N-acetylglucosamine synthase-like glycosyltransferase
MIDLEIPEPADRKGHYRFFEILPFALSITLIVLVFALSIINATVAAFFILFYIFMYLSRAAGVAFHSLYGYEFMRQNQRLNWLTLLHELELGKVGPEDIKRPKWHLTQLIKRNNESLTVTPSQLLHVVIVPTHNESREILESTIRSILASNYPMKRIIFIIAYEERGGAHIESQAKELISEHKDQFYYAEAIKHPQGIAGEIKGKGGNITYAGRQLQKYLERAGIDPLRVVVTTLDADNRPDKQYFACLSYAYIICPDPIRAAFQPIAMYTNNIWDAPAPMRVLATGNSLYNIVLSMRPHAMRNFSAHAQSMASLIETDYWSVRTVVEDGHQFWRSYFRFDGDYTVYPLHVPICQDAVLSTSYRKTLREQFVQLRRWTYGVSDVAYVIDKGFFHKNNVSRFDLLAKTIRLTEGHVNWAAAPIIMLIGGFVPILFHSQSLVANQLPNIISQVQTYALFCSVIAIYLCLRSLPPMPARYKRRRTIFMVLQWAYLPVTTIVYNSFAAFYSQARLAFGNYMDQFDATEKVTITAEKK